MNPMVTPAFVAERLQQPGVVILDATLPPVGVVPKPDTHATYLKRHLPGAIFFDIEKLSEQDTKLPHMLPTPERFGAEMGALGVQETDTLIVYEQAEVFSAPRAWWMLRVMGAREVYVLNGGLRCWIDAGLPTESGPVERPAAEFRVSLQRGAVVGFEELREELAAGTPVLDARSKGRFDGTIPEPREGLRAGHMPGATNVPYTELTEREAMRSPEELASVWRALGVDTTKPAITTCGSGVTAAVLALGLEICGAPAVRLYDGSWAEYGQRPEAVVETK